VCHIYERCADSTAAMKRLPSFRGDFAERCLAVLKPPRFVVYGAPSQAVQEALADSAPICRRSMDGLARQA
jgi:hypothetical protein